MNYAGIIFTAAVIGYWAMCLKLERGTKVGDYGWDEEDSRIEVDEREDVRDLEWEKEQKEWREAMMPKLGAKIQACDHCGDPLAKGQLYWWHVKTERTYCADGFESVENRLADLMEVGQ